MIFTGPPGTGKTTLAKVVGKVMLKMGLLESEKVHTLPIWNSNQRNAFGRYHITPTKHTVSYMLHVLLHCCYTCKVVEVGNALELVAGYAGQTPAKVVFFPFCFFFC
jgi:hypothetical protein